MVESIPEQKKIDRNIEKNLRVVKEKLGSDISFDIVIREFKIGDKKAALCHVDAFADDTVVALIMQVLVRLEREEVLPNIKEKIKGAIPYTDIEVKDKMVDIMDEVMAGPMALFIDGESEALILDTRFYPARDPQEPETERITRGSRDGFVETLVFNVGLIRRRVRDYSLRVHPYRIGKRSKSDVAILYLKDVVNPEIVENVKEKFDNIDVDGIPMAEKTIEEYIVDDYINPFPQVRYTERPDVASIHLLEGHVVVLVDTSPAAIILPATYFHHLHHAEEYRENALVGTYLRWVRFLGVLVSLFLVPLWLLFSLEPWLVPEFLAFIGPDEIGPIPLPVQFVFGHIFIDLIRMSAVHTPSPLATALGLVAALLIGEIAVEVGLFAPEVLLYSSFVAVGMFVTPSFELQLANRIYQLGIIVLTGIFGLLGFVVAVTLFVLLLARTNSFGVPYLWPFFPFDWNGFLAIVFRKPVPLRSFTRPTILKTKDKRRRRK